MKTIKFKIGAENFEAQINSDGSIDLFDNVSVLWDVPLPKGVKPTKANIKAVVTEQLKTSVNSINL